MNLEPIRALLELVKERNRLCEKGADFAAIETGERIPRLVYAASPALSQLLEAVTPVWVDSPTEQGLWWYWNGDWEDAPYPCNVLWSGTVNEYFVCRKDMETAPFCKTLKGKWLLAPTPSPPEDK